MNAAPKVAALLCATTLAVGCSTTTPGEPQSTASTPAAAGTTASQAAPKPPPPPPSDDAQIRQALKDSQDAYNTQNWDAYLDAMCAPMRARFTPSVMDYLKKDRARSGVTTMNITSVTINGDNATVAFDASNEQIGSGHDTIALKHEDEGWRVCQTYP
jgi:hypothetical protein